MKTLLKLEALALFVLSIFLFSRLPYPWWWYPLLFFVPDLSMVGYLRDPRVGAIVYNFVHHHAFSIGLYLLGFYLVIPLLQLAGVILLGHSNLDRLLGYGLKHTDSFQNTHLGEIGS
ncbi:MAG TPA: DUF4260 domain-containing protein [Anaerolineales bacterium]|jgi:uncharacterized membrane protein (Fun14 family)